MSDKWLIRGLAFATLLCAATAILMTINGPTFYGPVNSATLGYLVAAIGWGTAYFIARAKT